MQCMMIQFLLLVCKGILYPKVTQEVYYMLSLLATKNDQAFYTHIKKDVRKNVPKIFVVATLPTETDPAQLYPTKVELHSQ